MFQHNPNGIGRQILMGIFYAIILLLIIYSGYSCYYNYKFNQEHRFNPVSEEDKKLPGLHK